MVNVHTLIKILTIPGIGTVTARKLESGWGLATDRELLDFIYEESSKVPRVKLTRKIISSGIEKANRIIADSKNAGISFLSIDSASYPPLLKEIEHPPLVLSYKGDIESINIKGVAVIGTRKPTSQGLSSAMWCGKYLAENAFTVVSGLARGIDSAAHLGCLDAEGKTVAVLGNGLDTVYPYENKMLAKKILEAGGLIITECLIGEKANAASLLRRNRIVVSLCEKMIVVETGAKGGTMYTVEFGLKEGRKVGCLTTEDEKRPGNYKLLSDPKVTPLRNETEILDFLTSA